MTKNKDKQMRELRKLENSYVDRVFELETSRNMWQVFAILFILFTIVFVSLSVYYDLRMPHLKDLEQQLQSCQEKVPVLEWDDYCIHTNLGDYDKYVCSYNNGLFNITYILPKVIDEWVVWDRRIK